MCNWKSPYCLSFHQEVLGDLIQTFEARTLETVPDLETSGTRLWHRMAEGDPCDSSVGVPKSDLPWCHDGCAHLVPCGMEVHCEHRRSGWGKIPVAGEKQGRDSPILRLASVDVTPEAAAAIL